MPVAPDVFKAYDIRGLYGKEIDGDAAEQVGRAFVRVLAELDGGRVRAFREKPVSEHWVNGGFLVLEPGALDYLNGDSVLEREPLERLAADGALTAYRHEGFWRCLDTAKDAIALENAGPSRWLA